MKRVTESGSKLVLGLISLIPLLACAHTFSGRVIDSNTREPIEGGAVVVFWYEGRGDIAGEDTRLKDAKETLTDKDGNWSIRGPKGSAASNCILLLTFITGTHYTQEPDFIIFKPGYCSWPNGISLDSCKRVMKISGAGLSLIKDTVFSLRKSV